MTNTSATPAKTPAMLAVEEQMKSPKAAALKAGLSKAVDIALAPDAPAGTDAWARDVIERVFSAEYSRGTRSRIAALMAVARLAAAPQAARDTILLAEKLIDLAAKEKAKFSPTDTTRTNKSPDVKAASLKVYLAALKAAAILASAPKLGFIKLEKAFQFIATGAQDQDERVRAKAVKAAAILASSPNASNDIIERVWTEIIQPIFVTPNQTDYVCAAAVWAAGQLTSVPLVSDQAKDLIARGLNKLGHTVNNASFWVAVSAAVAPNASEREKMLAEHLAAIAYNVMPGFAVEALKAFAVLAKAPNASPKMFEKALQFIDRGFKDQDHHVRVAAVKAAAKLAAAPKAFSKIFENALQFIDRGFKDEDHHVRVAAVEVITTMAAAPNSKVAISQLAAKMVKSGFEDPDINVRTASIEGIITMAAAPHASPATVLSAMECIKTAFYYRPLDIPTVVCAVRGAAVIALSPQAPADAQKSIQSIILSAFQDDNPRVRAAAESAWILLNPQAGSGGNAAAAKPSTSAPKRPEPKRRDPRDGR